MQEITINRLATRTWNRLGVNEVKLEWDNENEKPLETTDFTAKRGECPAPLRIDVKDDGDGYSSKLMNIAAGADSAVTLFETVTAKSKLYTKLSLKIENGAKVRVVQLLYPDGGILRHEISAECGEKSEFDLLTIIMGSGDCYADNTVELRGDKSVFSADFGYLGRNSQTIDMNLTVNQYGKETESKITASGALLDAAKKVFRGTIDFKKGSAGSVGSENETVLLLGDDVSNKTVPIILCAEENVDGSHGATIGELDDATLFYFESRGIERAEAERVMARAAIERPARLSGDEEFEKLVLGLLGEE